MGGGSPLLELTALLRAAIVPMPFDFSRTFRYFSRAFSVPSFLCSPSISGNAIAPGMSEGVLPCRSSSSA